MKKLTGHCGCGKVSFEAMAESTDVVSCHCMLCQRLHGNYNPMVIIDKEHFTILRDEALAWFDSSESARRGFCAHCGSALFKEQTTGPKILISVGSLDDTTTCVNTKNVFTEEAGHYYVMPPHTR